MNAEPLENQSNGRPANPEFGADVIVLVEEVSPQPGPSHGPFWVAPVSEPTQPPRAYFPLLLALGTFLLVPEAGTPAEPYPDFTARAIGCGPAGAARRRNAHGLDEFRPHVELLLPQQRIGAQAAARTALTTVVDAVTPDRTLSASDDLGRASSKVVFGGREKRGRECVSANDGW